MSDAPSKMSKNQVIYENDDHIFYTEGKLRRIGPRKWKTDRIKSFLMSFCSEPIFSRMWLSIPDPEEKGLFPNEMKASHEMKLCSFALGTLVDMNVFVNHFDSSHHVTYRKWKDDLRVKFPVGTDNMNAHFQHDNHTLKVHFRVNNDRQVPEFNHRYQLKINYSAIANVVVHVKKERLSKQNLKGHQYLEMYLLLYHPPLLYEVDKDVDPYLELDADPGEVKVYSKSFNKYNKPKPKDDEINDNSQPQKMRWIRMPKFPFCDEQVIGKCSAVRLVFKDISDESFYERHPDKQKPDPWPILRNMNLFAKLPIHFSNIETHSIAELEKKRGRQLKFMEKLDQIKPYEVCWAMNCIFSISNRILDELIYKEQLRRFFEFVSIRSYNNEASVLEAALYDIYGALEGNRFIRILPALDKIFKERKRQQHEITAMKDDAYTELDLIKESIKEKVFPIKRGIMTPTRFIPQPPQPILASRFLRDADPTFTLRLQVRDDNSESLTFTLNGSEENQKHFLKKYVKIPIQEGIDVGGRKYKFLGNSSSQLRDLGLVMYADDERGRTASSIRDNIGDLEKIRNVAKYAARLGQAFSQSQAYIRVKQKYTQTVDDIKTDDGKFTFSDGIGMISVTMAKRAFCKFNNCKGPRECKCSDRLPPNQLCPSAFQIRYAGCKGMLVVNPLLEELHPGKHLVFRQSMNKYDSEGETLEILKVSEPREAFLNRPLITILEQLKEGSVPPSVFLQMQMDSIKEIMDAFKCECKAVKFLKDYCTLRLPFEDIFEARVPILDEPFFRELLECVMHRNMHLLKTKARIPIASTDGRTLFGVLDEHDCLEPGEVFIQYSVRSDNGSLMDMKVVQGDVLVTRSPCMHPGDVRKMRAVDKPQLKHIVDCVVFPAKGPRPHPDEMGGGDLDGDEYVVIWKREFTTFVAEPPMDFNFGATEELSRPVNVDDLLKFFCDYIQGANIGVIANAHLAISDRYEKGIHDEKTLRLAKMFHKSLDFAKTGETEKLSYRDRPTQYPDFMEKFSEKPTYVSKRALGQLYRQCRLFQLCIGEISEKFQFSSLDTKPDDPNHPLYYQGWEGFIKSADEAVKQYRLIMGYLIQQYGVDCEAALVSGSFAKPKSMIRESPYSDHHDMVEALVRTVFDNFIAKFNKDLDAALKTHPNVNNEVLRAQMASAWYIRSYQLNMVERHALVGLPWIISKQLSHLALMKRRQLGDMSCPIEQDEHDCLKTAVMVIDSSLKSKYEDADERSETRREKIDFILDIAEEKLTLWIDNCKHLKMGLTHSFDHMKSRFREMMDQVTRRYNYTETEIPSVGHIFSTVMQELIKEAFEPDSDLEKETYIPNALGFSALMTWQQFLRTHSVDYLWDEKVHLKSNRFARLSMMTLNISLFQDHRFRRLIEMARLDFQQALKNAVGATDIVGEYVLHYGDRYFLRLTAYGNQWSLELLRTLITQDKFQRNTVQLLEQAHGLPPSNGYSRNQHHHHRGGDHRGRGGGHDHHRTNNNHRTNHHDSPHDSNGRYNNNHHGPRTTNHNRGNRAHNNGHNGRRHAPFSQGTEERN